VGFVDNKNFPIAFCVVLENKYSTPAVAENIVTTMLNSPSRSFLKNVRFNKYCL
jgi:hypothetical protein